MQRNYGPFCKFMHEGVRFYLLHPELASSSFIKSFIKSEIGIEPIEIVSGVVVEKNAFRVLAHGDFL